MDSLSAAVRDVMGGLPTATAARKHGVGRTTLRWRLQAEERAQAGKRPTGAVKTALMMYDGHFPHDEWPHILMAVEYAKSRYNVTHVMLAGDWLDCEGISRFAKGADTMPLHEEISYAVYKLEMLRGMFKDAAWTYIKGNHEHRLQAYLWNKAAEIAALKGLTIPEQLELDRLGITWVDNDALKQATGRYFRFGKLNVLHGHELGTDP